jgi:hypothetical protein
MSIVNSLNSGQIKDFQGKGDDYSLGGTGNLLLQLEDRVNQARGQKDMALGGNGEQAAEKITPQQMVNFLVEISQQSIPGMNHNILV